MAGRANVENLSLGQGAKFWVYVSPSSNTASNVAQWSVIVEQPGSGWIGTITSDNPAQELQTPGLSGTFNVTVRASGPKFAEKTLTHTSDSTADIGCNANCAAMIGIVSNADGTDANYWTVWDAICSPE